MIIIAMNAGTESTRPAKNFIHSAIATSLHVRTEPMTGSPCARRKAISLILTSRQNMVGTIFREIPLPGSESSSQG